MTSRHASDTLPIHVLHVIDGIGVGGAEIVLAQLVEQLQAVGHRNTVVALTAAGPIGQRLVAADARLVTLDMRRRGAALGAVRRLIGTVREAAPDVVQGWMYHGNFAASVARRLARSPAALVWSVHNTLEPPPPLPPVTRLALHLERLGSADPAAIIYVSAASAGQHERLGFRSDRTRVIANGTDCERFRPRPGSPARLRATLGVEGDMPLVGLLARWHPMKGHHILFAVLRRLRDAGRPVHLVLAGSGMGVDNGELMAALGAAGVAAADVSLLGVRDDVDAIMAGLDLFVLPSVDGEAFPLVLGEAMAAGVPCIASDIGDSRLIVGDTGIIVPPNDPAALAAACEALLDAGPAAREALGRRARERIAARFSIDRMAGAYIELYERLVRSERQPQPRLVSAERAG